MTPRPFDPHPDGVSYVLPLRWENDRGLGELAAYLDRISARAEAIVVDGSPPEAFERHAGALPAAVRHLAPHPDLNFAMGKVNGVITGVREASFDRVVLADDDVRYDPAALAAVAKRLTDAELVVPQNFFDPLPWHARWDTARTLLNRVVTGDRWFPATDFPGTLGVWRRFFLGIGAYDGDLIFENLELMRTVRAAGGRVELALDLFVRRHPPSTDHFLSQRVRQAYDDFAIPGRIAAFLALGPFAAFGARRDRRVALALATAGAALAELGRRRAGGARVYPPSSSLLAPAWLAERSVCAWIALAQRLAGGTRYAGGRIERSATSPADLERRYATLLREPFEDGAGERPSASLAA